MTASLPSASYQEGDEEERSPEFSHPHNLRDLFVHLVFLSTGAEIKDNQKKNNRPLNP